MKERNVTRQNGQLAIRISKAFSMEPALSDLRFFALW
jgi:hypothetical protein